MNIENQQQPVSFLVVGFNYPGYGVEFLGLSSDLPYLALIDWASDINAYSTLVFALAEASINLMFKLSANSFPSS